MLTGCDELISARSAWQVRQYSTSYDENKLSFRVTKEEADTSYLRNERPEEAVEKDESETHIPVVEERLGPTTKVVIEQATIVKEPVKGSSNS